MEKRIKFPILTSASSDLLPNVLDLIVQLPAKQTPLIVTGCVLPAGEGGNEWVAAWGNRMRRRETADREKWPWFPFLK